MMTKEQTIFKLWPDLRLSICQSIETRILDARIDGHHEILNIMILNFSKEQADEVAIKHCIKIVK